MVHPTEMEPNADQVNANAMMADAFSLHSESDTTHPDTLTDTHDQDTYYNHSNILNDEDGMSTIESLLHLLEAEDAQMRASRLLAHDSTASIHSSMAETYAQLIEESEHTLPTDPSSLAALSRAIYKFGLRLEHAPLIRLSCERQLDCVMRAMQVEENDNGTRQAPKSKTTQNGEYVAGDAMAHLCAMLRRVQQEYESASITSSSNSNDVEQWHEHYSSFIHHHLSDIQKRMETPLRNILLPSPSNSPSPSSPSSRPRMDLPDFLLVLETFLQLPHSPPFSSHTHPSTSSTADQQQEQGESHEFTFIDRILAAQAGISLPCESTSTLGCSIDNPVSLSLSSAHPSSPSSQLIDPSQCTSFIASLQFARRLCLSTHMSASSPSTSSAEFASLRAQLKQQSSSMLEMEEQLSQLHVQLSAAETRAHDAERRMHEVEQEAHSHLSQLQQMLDSKDAELMHVQEELAQSSSDLLDSIRRASDSEQRVEEMQEEVRRLAKENADLTMALAEMREKEEQRRKEREEARERIVGSTVASRSRSRSRHRSSASLGPVGCCVCTPRNDNKAAAATDDSSNTADGASDSTKPSDMKPDGAGVPCAPNSESISGSANEEGDAVPKPLDVALASCRILPGTPLSPVHADLILSLRNTNDTLKKSIAELRCEVRRLKMREKELQWDMAMMRSAPKTTKAVQEMTNELQRKIDFLEKENQRLLTDVRSSRAAVRQMIHTTRKECAIWRNEVIARRDERERMLAELDDLAFIVASKSNPDATPEDSREYISSLFPRQLPSVAPSELEGLLEEWKEASRSQYLPLSQSHSRNSSTTSSTISTPRSKDDENMVDGPFRTPTKNGNSARKQRRPLSGTKFDFEASPTSSSSPIAITKTRSLRQTSINSQEHSSLSSSHSSPTSSARLSMPRASNLTSALHAASNMSAAENTDRMNDHHRRESELQSTIDSLAHQLKKLVEEHERVLAAHHKLSKEATELRTTNAELNTQAKKLASANVDAPTHVTRSPDSVKSAQKIEQELVDKHRSEIEQLQAALQTSEVALADAEQRLCQSNERSRMLEAERDELQHQLDAMNEKGTGVAADSLTVKEKAELESKIADIQAHKNTLQAELEQANSQVQQLTSEKITMEQQLQHVNSTLKQAQTESSDLSMAVVAAEGQVVQLQSDKQTLAEQISALQSALEEVERSKCQMAEHYQTQLSQACDELQRSRLQLNESSARIHSLQAQLSEREAELAQLKNEDETRQSLQSQFENCVLGLANLQQEFAKQGDVWREQRQRLLQQFTTHDQPTSNSRPDTAATGISLDSPAPVFSSTSSSHTDVAASIATTMTEPSPSSSVRREADRQSASDSITNSMQMYTSTYKQTTTGNGDRDNDDESDDDGDGIECQWQVRVDAAEEEEQEDEHSNIRSYECLTASESGDAVQTASNTGLMAYDGMLDATYLTPSNDHTDAACSVVRVSPYPTLVPLEDGDEDVNESVCNDDYVNDGDGVMNRGHHSHHPSHSTTMSGDGWTVCTSDTDSIVQPTDYEQQRHIPDLLMERRPNATKSHLNVPNASHDRHHDFGQGSLVRDSLSHTESECDTIPFILSYSAPPTLKDEDAAGLASMTNEA